MELTLEIDIKFPFNRKTTSCTNIYFSPGELPNLVQLFLPWFSFISKAGVFVT